MKTYMFLFIFLLVNMAVNAAWITLTGTNTGASSQVAVSPYSYALKARHVQYVYTKEEIQAAGGLPGNITAMKWYVQEVVSGLLNYEIKMAHTNATDASSHINLSDYTTVLATASLVLGGSENWRTITFNAPFNWNGVQNIVVDICFGLNTQAYTAGSILMYNVDMPNQMRGVGSNSTTVCSTVTTLAVNGKPAAQLEMNVNTCQSATNVHFPAVGGLFSVVKWTHPTNYNPDKYVVKLYLTSSNYLINTYELNYPISHLTMFTVAPSTEYSVYVHSKCGNNLMDPVGPFYFNTVGLFSLPYHEYFMNLDGYHFPEGVSYMIQQGMNAAWEIVPTSTANHYAAQYTTIQNDGQMKAYLISPKISFNANANYKVSFKYDLLWGSKDEKVSNADVVLGPVSGGVKSHWVTHSYSGSANVQNVIIEKDVYALASVDYTLSFYTGVEGNLHPCQFRVDSISVRELYKEAEILSFNLSGQSGQTIIDSGNGTISLNVPPPADLSNMVPTLSISQGATITPNPSIPQNFNQPVHYTVTAEDTTIVKSWTVYVNGNQNVTTLSQNVTIYPNPATHEILINSTKPISWKIYDIRGRLIVESSRKSEQHLVDITSLSEGVYFLHCVGNEHSVVKVFSKL